MVGTQISASQHVQIVGTKAHIEVQTSFVPPRMSVDDSTRLDDPVPREIGLLEIDPYELEDTNFARAARAEAELEFGVENQASAGRRRRVSLGEVRHLGTAVKSSIGVAAG